MPWRIYEFVGRFLGENCGQTASFVEAFDAGVYDFHAF